MKEQGLQAYMIPFHRQPKVNLRSQRAGNNSLPSISQPRDERINTIRHQINTTKEQITVLKARINSLRFEKSKNDRKKHKNEQQVEFIRTVRNRVQQDQLFKQKIEQKQKRELEKLKLQVNLSRENMVKNRELAKSIVSQRKSEGADEERKRKKEDEDYVKHVRSIEIAENQLKAKSIKQEQLQIKDKMRQFTQSRLNFAKGNHAQRVEKTLKEKSKVQKTLKKLKQQEEKLLEDCKESEVGMMNSLYELECLNDRKNRFPRSSRNTYHKYS